MLEHVHGAVAGGVPRFDVVVGEAHEVLPLELEVQLGKAGPGGGGDQRVVDGVPSSLLRATAHGTEAMVLVPEVVHRGLLQEDGQV